ncbi:MAG TPA: hypothetical protein VMW53_09975 [archaeon]|nr:hypothetical protein [archaeon]
MKLDLDLLCFVCCIQVVNRCSNQIGRIDAMDVSAVDAPAALARLKEEGCIYTRKDEFD